MSEQSDALLIYAVMNDIYPTSMETLDLDAKRLVVDHIISGDYDKIGQYVPDSELSLKLLNYGLYKEIYGKEEEVEAINDKEVNHRDYNPEVQEIRDSLTDIKAFIFDQVHNMVTSMLDAFGIEDIEQQQEIEKAISENIAGQMDEMHKGQLSYMKRAVTKINETPDNSETQIDFLAMIMGGKENLFNLIGERETLQSLRDNIADQVGVIVNTVLDEIGISDNDKRSDIEQEIRSGIGDKTEKMGRNELNNVKGAIDKVSELPVGGMEFLSSMVGGDKEVDNAKEKPMKSEFEILGSLLSNMGVKMQDTDKKAGEMASPSQRGEQKDGGVRER